MWNLKIKQMNLIQNRNRLTDTEKQTYGYQGERDGGMGEG